MGRKQKVTEILQRVVEVFLHHAGGVFLQQLVAVLHSLILQQIVAVLYMVDYKIDTTASCTKYCE